MADSATLNLSGDFRNRILNAFADKGKAWLEYLPKQIEESEFHFNIKIGNRLRHLSYNYVAEAKQGDGKGIIVKFAAPTNNFVLEIQALEFMWGAGAVQVISFDKQRQVALLEKLVPGEMLATITDDEQATLIAANVMKNLWKPITQYDYNFPTTQQWFARLEQPIKTPADFPRDLIDKANVIAKKLHQSSSEQVLLHGDLHHFNILSAKRQPWLAIDPKGVVGEREYEVGALLRNPIPDIATTMNTTEILARRVDYLSEILGFERRKIIGWGFSQAVLAAVWSLDDQSEDWRLFIKCAEILSEFIKEK